MNKDEFREYATTEDYFICRRCAEEELNPDRFSFARCLKRFVKLRVCVKFATLIYKARS